MVDVMVEDMEAIVMKDTGNVEAAVVAVVAVADENQYKSSFNRL